MRIGIDIDSVLAEIIAPLDSFHNEKYKTHLSYEDHVVYDLKHLWNCTDKETYERIDEFYSSPFFYKTKPIKGSRRYVSRLSQDHELIVITSRPSAIEHHSNTWIEKHFPKKFKKICHTNQVSLTGKKKTKSQICREEQIHVMIDDHLDYAIDCASVGVRVLLFTAPWNRSVVHLPNGITRVNNWQEVMKHI